MQPTEIKLDEAQMKSIWFFLKFHFFYLNLLEFSLFVFFLSLMMYFPFFHRNFRTQEVSDHMFPINIMLTAIVKQQMTTCTEVIGNSSPL